MLFRKIRDALVRRSAAILNEQLNVKPEIQNLAIEFNHYFDQMHRRPGLAFDEKTETLVVKQKLHELGLSFHTFGGGIVCAIEGSSSESGRMIGLSADMDALPIEENPEGKNVVSENHGVSHLCGHDGHTVSLLMAAEYLATTRNFDGTAVLIWRPAEETGEGVNAMLDDGLLEKFPISEIYGYHNFPNHPVGFGGVSEGPVLAASVDFKLSVQGAGGHAGFSDVPRDEQAIYKMNAFLEEQKKVTRRGRSVFLRQNSDARVGKALVNFSSLESNSKAPGVLSTRVTATGTIRALDERDIESAVSSLRDIWIKVHGGDGSDFSVKLDKKSHVPTLYNSAVQTEVARSAMKSVLGEKFKVHGFPPQTGTDDFTNFPVPKCYMALTNGDVDTRHPHSQKLHAPEYMYNKDLLPIAASVYAEIVEQRLSNYKEKDVTASQERCDSLHL